MDKVTAQDVMVPLDSYPHIPYWFSLRQAMVEMEKGQLESSDGRKSIPRVVLVFDERYQLMGLVRRRDIFRGLEPEFLDHTTAGMVVHDKGDFSELSTVSDLDGLRQRAEKPVSEIMQPIQATVTHDSSVMHIAKQMVHYNMSVIPVLKDDRVVGVVRSVDVFHQISRAIL